jgi:glycosyltransferase family protein
MKIKKYFLFALNAIKDILKFSYLKTTEKFPKVLTIEETLDLILSEQKSFTRYGDGEFNLIYNIPNGFQEIDKLLSKRLNEVLLSDAKNCLICIPGSLHSLTGMVWQSKLMWIHLIGNYYKNYNTNFNFLKIYPNSLMTRPYMDLCDKNRSVAIFKKLKKIWENRDIIIVEGEHTKLGVGNDLFANSKTIKRVITVTKNAFAKYDLLYDEIKKSDKQSLILIALGPTATVLAYDLSKIGLQACDVGHMDIEYEWFIKKTLKKTAIYGKFVNEVSTDNPRTSLLDANYDSQIITKIL